VNDSSKQFYRVVNVSRSDLVIAQRVTWACSSSERRRGLLGYSSLSADEGIYLVPCEWLHTFGMRFSIDVAFLSADGRVLSVHHGLKPNRLSKIVPRAQGALELMEGTLHSTGTEIGDVVRFLNIATPEPILL
jgi:uncharacterized membrane protein (UPF0127 family)